MQRLVVCGLFGFTADQRHFLFGRFHGAPGLGGDFNFAIRSGDRADRRFPILQGDVQRLFALDLLNRVKLDGDISRRVGVQQQRLAVGLDDRARKAIAVLQSDLIGQ